MGTAVTSGLLELGPEDDAPLAERSLRLPPPLVLALAGAMPNLGGLQLLDRAEPPLPGSLAAEAARYAQLLARHARSALILRTSSIADGLAAATAIATAGGSRALVCGAGKTAPRWLGPLCRLVGAVPVLQPELSPGERRELGWPPGLAGGLIVVSRAGRVARVPGCRRDRMAPAVAEPGRARGAVAERARRPDAGAPPRARASARSGTHPRGRCSRRPARRARSPHGRPARPSCGARLAPATPVWTRWPARSTSRSTRARSSFRPDLQARPRSAARPLPRARRACRRPRPGPAHAL